jgi:hypothetical protein
LYWLTWVNLRATSKILEAKQPPVLEQPVQPVKLVDLDLNGFRNCYSRKETTWTPSPSAKPRANCTLAEIA